MNELNSKQLYRVKDVASVVSVGVSTIYKWVSEGSFPPGVQLTGKCTVWTQGMLDEWMESKGLASKEKL